MFHIKFIHNKPKAILPLALVLIGLIFVLHKVNVVSHFWNDPDTVRQWMGHFLGLNLRDMASWQSTAAHFVDLMLWGLLYQGWWYSAKAAWEWHQNNDLNELVIEHFNRCVVYVSTAWALTMLVRPFRNLLVQWHLPIQQWVFKWQYVMSDVVTLMLCLCLLLMAKICKKWQSTDQENKEFI